MSLKSGPSSKRSKRQQAQDIVSPFRLPNDEEVFIFRESEKQKKQQIKKKNKNLRIWDKKTASCRNPKRQFRNYIDEDELREQIKNEQRNKFNSKDRELINEAYEIVRQRQKNKETLKTKKGLATKKKEGIVELIEQKKEMFLVEKTCNIIKQEIKNLDRKREARAKALQSSIRLMEDDDRGFDKFKMENTKSTQKAMARADDKLEERKKLENQIKKLRQNLNQVTSLNTRIDEEEQNFKIYKEFLDSITSKIKNNMYQEWEENKKREKEEVTSEALVDYMDQAKQEQKQYRTQQSRRVGQNRVQRQQERKPKTDDEIKVDFYADLQKGKIDKVEVFENSYPMYFTKPNQLISIFNVLEERNLGLILDTQNLTQLRDINRKKFRLEQIQKEEDYQSQLKARQQLSKLIKAEERQINLLKKKKLEHTQQSLHITKDPLREKIKKIFDEHSENMSNPISIGPKTKTITILSTIEEFLEDILLNLNNNYLPSQINEQKLKIGNENKRLKQQKFQQKKILDDKNRLINAQKKRSKHAKKRHGRRDMTKTKPITKKKVEVKQSDLDSETLRQAIFLRPGFGPHCLQR